MDKPVCSICLAEPEVFCLTPSGQGDRKVLIEEVGRMRQWPFRLAGFYPVNSAIPDFRPERAAGLRMYRANTRMMDKAHFVSADIGAGIHADRASRCHGLDPDHRGRAAGGLAVEDFGMSDNLMMIGALDDTGTRIQPYLREAIKRIAESLL